jgi:hypothetical protein
VRQIRSITFLWFSFLSFAVFAQKPQQGDTLYWSQDYELTLEDFKKWTPSSGLALATLSRFLFGKKYYDGNCYVTVYSYFLRSQSMKSRPYIKSLPLRDSYSYDYILKHERGHFDLTEIMTRDIRKKITALTSKKYSKKKLDRKLYKIYATTLNNRGKIQYRYDKETNHSQNKENQQKWDAYIKERLEELKEYTDTLIVIPCKKCG